MPASPLPLQIAMSGTTTLQRKGSNETLITVGTNSTLDSRISSTDVPQMELMQVDYSHPLKEVIITNTNTNINTSNKNNNKNKKNNNNLNVNFPETTNQKTKNRLIRRKSATELSIRKTMPTVPPPPTIESWHFLENSERTTTSPPKVIPAMSTPKAETNTFSESSPGYRCKHHFNNNDALQNQRDSPGQKKMLKSTNTGHNYSDSKQAAVVRSKQETKHSYHLKDAIKHHLRKSQRYETVERETTGNHDLSMRPINQMFKITHQNQTNESLSQIDELLPQLHSPASIMNSSPANGKYLKLISHLRDFNAIESNGKRLKYPNYLHQTDILMQKTDVFNINTFNLRKQETILSQSEQGRFVANKPIATFEAPASFRKTKMLGVASKFHDGFREICTKIKRTSTAAAAAAAAAAATATTATSATKNSELFPLNDGTLYNSHIRSVSYHKLKVERVHIRKKRQPLSIINQLNEQLNEQRRLRMLGECSKGQVGKQQLRCMKTQCCHPKNSTISKRSDQTDNSHTSHKEIFEENCDKTKRLSLESNSDSGVSSYCDPLESNKSTNNNHNNNSTNDNCTDCEKQRHLLSVQNQQHRKLNESRECEFCILNEENESENYDKVETVTTTKTQTTQLKSEMEKSSLICNRTLNPNKSSTTDNETKKHFEQTASSLEDLKLDSNSDLGSSSSKDDILPNNGTTNIPINDDWVGDDVLILSEQNNDDDFLDTDSLIINSCASDQTDQTIQNSDNCVKIFVKSASKQSEICRTPDKLNSSHSALLTQTSRNNSHNSCDCLSITSSATSLESSHSFCSNENYCCCRDYNNNANDEVFNSSITSSINYKHDQNTSIAVCANHEGVCRGSSSYCGTSGAGKMQFFNGASSGGVFWNTAYFNQIDHNELDVCYSCCNRCPYSDDNYCSCTLDSQLCENDYQTAHMENVEYRKPQRRSIRSKLRNSSSELLLIRNKTLVNEGDLMTDIRPRSMDGIIDSAILLNTTHATSCIDSNSYSHHHANQQDLETRRLKRGHVLTELLETERIYVNEMSSILKGYRDQMHSEEMLHLVPASLQGKEDVLFGNLHELYTFHNDIFLKDLENCISTTELVALCFVQRRDTFYRLYSFYCQNIPRSERLRETLVDTHLFLQECQKRLGHKLPLAAYLLKPVQRITKYQLLLKDLLRFSDSGNCTKELQKALDCMLIVLKCVNDSMHQVAINGFPTDLAQQGELLLQNSFQVWSESKRDIRLRIKSQQRHIFLYQKSMLFCKQTSKSTQNKSTYQFKYYLKMSQIGLTESVRGDAKRFEVWLQGRQEVHTLQAPTIEIKNKWVNEIKRVLLNQLEELKGEKIKQYALNNRGMHRATWETPNILQTSTQPHTISCDASSESSNRNSICSSCDDNYIGAPALAAIGNSNASPANNGEKDASEACAWSSDYSNSEDEQPISEDNSIPGNKYIAQADYKAAGHSEISLHENDTVELLKIGCAGWWYVRILDTNTEGWTPAAYLEPLQQQRKASSQSSSRNQNV